MSAGDYYGRVDYTCKKSIGDNLFNSVIGLLEAIIRAVPRLFVRDKRQKAQV
jgi:hypothetical protein